MARRAMIPARQGPPSGNPGAIPAWLMRTIAPAARPRISPVLRLSLLIACFALLLPAQEEALRIRGWIADLESPDYARREAASKSLEAAGASAAEALRAARERASPEARLRIDALLLQSGARIETPRFTFEGTRVQFPPEPRPFVELLQVLMRANNSEIRCSDGNMGGERDAAGDPASDTAWARASITPPATELTWMQAFEYLTSAAGVWWRRESDGAITLSPGRKPGGHVVQDGVVRCALNSINITRSLSHGQPPYAAMHTQFQLDLEPGPLPLYILQPVMECRATDNQGRAVAPQLNAGVKQHANFLGPMRQSWLNASFEPPARDAKSLAELKLVLAFVVPEEVLEHELQPLRQESAPTGPGPSAVLRADGHLEVSWPAVDSEPLAGVSGVIAQEQLTLLDAAGQPVALPNFSGTVHDGTAHRGFANAASVATVRIMAVRRWRLEQRTLIWRDLQLP